MKKFNFSDPKEIALIEIVTEVYLREGMKRITMDDMSANLITVED